VAFKSHLGQRWKLHIEIGKPRCTNTDQYKESGRPAEQSFFTAKIQTKVMGLAGTSSFSCSYWSTFAGRANDNATKKEEFVSDLSSTFVSDLKPKWRERFEFFEQFGAPSSPEFRAAYKELPRNKKQLINLNWFGFFFGPFYWLVLGMWRRALTWIGLAVAIGVAEDLFTVMTGIDFPRALDLGISVAFAIAMAMTTNYQYYLKRIKGDNGWNPFKGIRWL
jgi:hypothetical protein